MSDKQIAPLMSESAIAGSIKVIGAASASIRNESHPLTCNILTHIITHAPDYLLPGGMLWLEHGYDQAPAVQALLNAQHFTQIQTYPDLNGMPRATCGQMH